MRHIVGLLILLGVAVTLAGCTSDGGTDLKADFSSRFEQPNAGPTSCPVTAIHFQDRTTGGPTGWEWAFGDGSMSSEQNPTWETSAVVAEVTLTARRGDAEDSVTRTISTHEC
jgi:PKD repeat protein